MQEKEGTFTVLAVAYTFEQYRKCSMLYKLQFPWGIAQSRSRREKKPRLEESDKKVKMMRFIFVYSVVGSERATILGV